MTYPTSGGLITMEIVCTSSVRPFNVPKDAGVGVFSFTSNMINLHEVLASATDREFKQHVYARERNTPNPR